MRGWAHGRCCGRRWRSWPARPPVRRRRRPSPAAGSMYVNVASLPRQVDPGRLELRVAVEGGHPLVATESRLLEAAERHGDVGGVEGVHPDDTRTDRAGQAVRSVEIPCPDPRGQAVGRVVGDGEGVGLVLELGHGQDRAEDLLAGDAPAIVDPVEDRRLDVEPPAVLAHALTAGHDPGALLTPELDVTEDLRQLPVVDDGAEPRGGIERLAWSDRPAEVCDPLDELLADAPMDDEPRARVAGLARVVEDPPPDRGRGRLEVADIRQDELRTLATELERDGLDVRLADRAQQRLPDLRGAREGDLVDCWMAGEGRAEHGTRARDHVEHAIRETRLGRELRESQGGERR